jgi:hypothetical protein
MGAPGNGAANGSQLRDLVLTGKRSLPGLLPPSLRDPAQADKKTPPRSDNGPVTRNRSRYPACYPREAQHIVQETLSEINDGAVAEWLKAAVC